jgi:hypothetical protein
VHSPPNHLADAAYHLGLVTGRREVCEGAVKKLRAQLAAWRVGVAKRPGLLALLLTGMAEPLVLELERLVATSEAELVGLVAKERELNELYQHFQRTPQAPAAAEELEPRPLAKARPRAKR